MPITRPISGWIRACVMGSSLATAILAGTLIGGVIASGGKLLGDGERLIEALALGSVVSAPMTIPGGLIAGLLAVRALGRAEVGRTRRAWALLGLRRGSAIGALVAAAYVGAVMIGADDPLDGALLVLYMAALGAIAGATAGVAVGLCCARTARRLEPAR